MVRSVDHEDEETPKGWSDFFICYHILMYAFARCMVSLS